MGYGGGFTQPGRSPPPFIIIIIIIIANCIIEGAQNARGGERLDSNSIAAGSLR